MRTASDHARYRLRAFLLAILLAGVVTGGFWRRWHPPVPAATARHSAEVASRNPGARLPSSTTALRADEPRHEPTTDPGVDAANIYKNAFVLFDRLSEEEKKMIRQPREEVDAGKAAALFEKIRAIMELLRDAAKADYCHWGLAPYTFESPLPHVPKAMDLGKLALWAAAYQFPTDPPAALDALAVRAQLGHHVADTLVGLLVETSFEASAHDLLRQNLGSFDAVTAAQAGAFLRASTIDADIAGAFDTEVASSEATARLFAAKTPEERAQMLGAAGAAEPDSAGRAAMGEAIAVFGDPVRLATELAFIRSTEEAMGDAMKLPEAEFQSWWKGVERELASGHPLAKITLPAVAAVQRKVQQTRVERTLLSAGLDVLQGGPAQLAGYQDPATGNALLYVPTPAGFELRSTYEVKGKPVTFSFSQPK